MGALDLRGTRTGAPGSDHNASSDSSRLDLDRMLLSAGVSIIVESAAGIAAAYLVL